MMDEDKKKLEQELRDSKMLLKITREKLDADDQEIYNLKAKLGSLTDENKILVSSLLSYKA